MKKIYLMFCALPIVITSFAMAAASLHIDVDEDDCVDGWISMDVRVIVDGENFSFNPSCSFSFGQTFETKNGLRCEIESGMCSGFWPYDRIEVNCKDGARTSAPIECPEEE